MHSRFKTGDKTGLKSFRSSGCVASVFQLGVTKADQSEMFDD